MGPQKPATPSPATATASSPSQPSVAVTCAFFAVTAPRPIAGTDLATLLSSNPELYNLSLGHLFDLTGAAMGLFRGPLIAVALGMVILGPVSFALRRRRKPYPANLTLAAGMTLVLLAAHQGLVRFYPILGSKPLADAILHAQTQHPEPADLILLDGELTSGSTLLFYTRQPVHLVNGRINGPWFGSFWPDAPPIFENEASLRELWQGPRRLFFMTYVPASRTHDLHALRPRPHPGLRRRQDHPHQPLTLAGILRDQRALVIHDLPTLIRPLPDRRPTRPPHTPLHQVVGQQISLAAQSPARKLSRHKRLFRRPTRMPSLQLIQHKLPPIDLPRSSNLPVILSRHRREIIPRRTMLRPMEDRLPPLQLLQHRLKVHPELQRDLPA